MLRAGFELEATGRKRLKNDLFLAFDKVEISSFVRSVRHIFFLCFRSKMETDSDNKILYPKNCFRSIHDFLVPSLLHMWPSYGMFFLVWFSKEKTHWALIRGHNEQVDLIKPHFRPVLSISSCVFCISHADIWFVLDKVWLSVSS